MRLAVQLKLQPSYEQAALLRQTLERANAAANTISRLAWEHQVFRQFDLHRLAYHQIRAETGLGAQVVVRLLAKVAHAYKLGRKRPRRFRPLGSVAYDSRLLKLSADSVSVWTVGGRQKIPFVCGDRQRQLLAYQQGECDIVFRDGQWYLYATINDEEPSLGEANDWIGVDLGVVNFAVDSDGTVYSGSHLHRVRSRNARLRAKLQRKGTKSAKRVLRRRRSKEKRFATWVNHNVSKSIVREAQRTGRGIALEQLKGIRDRIRARRRQRRTLHSWAFGQLQSFVSYKATRAGVPVQFVDPRNTSRTCSCCGHIDRANRPSQSRFSCQNCGYSALADLVAAQNIRALGGVAVNQPDAVPLTG